MLRAGVHPWVSPYLTLSVPNFGQHLLSACFFFFLFFFKKLLIGKKFICKVEKLNIKQCRP